MVLLKALSCHDNDCLVFILIGICIIIAIGIILYYALQSGSSALTTTNNGIPIPTPNTNNDANDANDAPIASGSALGGSNNTITTGCSAPPSISPFPTPTTSNNLCGCDYGFSYAYNQLPCQSQYICLSQSPYCKGYIFDYQYGTCSSTANVTTTNVSASDGTTGTCVYVPLGSDLAFVSFSFSTSGTVNIEYITMPSNLTLSTQYPSVFPIFVLRGDSHTWLLANSNSQNPYTQGQFNLSSQLWFYDANLGGSNGPVPTTYIGGGGFYACGVVYLDKSYNTTSVVMTGNDNQNITTCLTTPVSVDCSFMSLLINQPNWCSTNLVASNQTGLNMNTTYTSIVPVHGIRGTASNGYWFFSNCGNSYLMNGSEGWGTDSTFTLYSPGGGRRTYNGGRQTYNGGGGLFGNGMVLLSASPSTASGFTTTSLNSGSVTAGYCPINAYCGFLWISCSSTSTGSISSLDLSSLITNAGVLTNTMSVIPIYAYGDPPTDFNYAGVLCNAQNNPSPLYMNMTPDPHIFYIYSQNASQTEGATSSSLTAGQCCIASGLVFL